MSGSITAGMSTDLDPLSTEEPSWRTLVSVKLSAIGAFYTGQVGQGHVPFSLVGMTWPGGDLILYVNTQTVMLPEVSDLLIRKKEPFHIGSILRHLNNFVSEIK